MYNRPQPPAYSFGSSTHQPAQQQQKDNAQQAPRPASYSFGALPPKPSLAPSASAQPTQQSVPKSGTMGGLGKVDLSSAGSQRGFKETAIGGRRKREDDAIQLRKHKRDDVISQKRRQLTNGEISHDNKDTKNGKDNKDNNKTDNDHPESESDADERKLRFKHEVWVPTIRIIPDQNHRVDVVKCREFAEFAKKTVQSQPTLRTVRQQYLMEFVEIADGLNSNDRKMQLASAIKMRKALAIEYQPPVQEIIDAGFIPRTLYLAGFASTTAHNDPSARQLQHECLWACTNIASGTSRQTRYLVECSAIPLFLHSMNSINEDIWSQAVWAIGNLAGDCMVLRDTLLKAGAIPLIINRCSKATKNETYRNIAWTFSNLARGKPHADWELAKMCLPALVKLVNVKDSETVSDACWAVSHLTDDSTKENTKIDAVVSTNILPTIVEILKTGTAELRRPALRILGHVASGNEQHTLAVINAGALPILRNTLTDPKPSLRKEACWTLSNITTGGPEQIQTVIEALLMQPLIHMVQSSSTDFETRREATWAVCNATGNASPAQIRYMVKYGLLQALCAQLVSEESSVIINALEALRNVLSKTDQQGATNADQTYKFLIEEADGRQKLDALSGHDNEEVYDLATKLVTDFFPEDEDDDPDAAASAAAAVGASSFSFGNQSTPPPPQEASTLFGNQNAITPSTSMAKKNPSAAAAAVSSSFYPSIYQPFATPNPPPPVTSSIYPTQPNLALTSAKPPVTVTSFPSFPGFPKTHG